MLDGLLVFFFISLMFLLTRIQASILQIVSNIWTEIQRTIDFEKYQTENPQSNWPGGVREAIE